MKMYAVFYVYDGEHNFEGITNNPNGWLEKHNTQRIEDGNEPENEDNFKFYGVNYSFETESELKPYAISTSDGHDEDWTYYTSELEAHETFIYMQGYESDIHLYKFSSEFGYEVIDSWCDGDE